MHRENPNTTTSIPISQSYSVQTIEGKPFRRLSTETERVSSRNDRLTVGPAFPLSNISCFLY